MNPGATEPHFGPCYSSKMASAIASCMAAISRLDARISVSLVGLAWTRRAAWTGYAKALQLQSVEIDEIDVFSWGCGLQVPGRVRRVTHLDQFDQFDNWDTFLRNSDRLGWRDRLPTSIGEPAGAGDHPSLIRALDRVRQHARVDGSLWPWLGMPFALRDYEISTTPLPCLASGIKAFRLKKSPSDADWLMALRGLEEAAAVGIERLGLVERLFRDARRAIVEEYRPGALPALFALAQHRPLLSPQVVANLLSLSVAGASKLLERAKAIGLLVEITQRRSWRLFLTPDLASEMGYVSAKRGRPAKELPDLPLDRNIAAVFDGFDEEMAKIDALLSTRGLSPAEPRKDR